MNDNQQQTYMTKELLPPPSERIPVLRWLKQNLFSSWLNAILTVAAAVLIGVVAFGLLRWAVGARWAVVPANLKLLLVGTYPAQHLWRVWVAVYVMSFLLGLSSGSHGGLMRRISVTVALVSVVFALVPFPWATRAWLIGIAITGAAGFGLGFERFIRFVCGLDYVWQAASFPKVPGVHSP